MLPPAALDFDGARLHSARKPSVPLSFCFFASFTTGTLGWTPMLPPLMLETTAVSARWSGPMDWDRVEGNWKQIRGKVKEKWGRLTDDELNKINGRWDQLAGMIQERYGIAKDQARKDVEAWFKALRW
jgi:uncharacterized protein YjbJ (UPF0337 family)